MVNSIFGIVKEHGRIIHRRKGQDDVDVTNRCVTITFEGAQASGKTVLLRAFMDRVAPNAVYARPDEHKIMVIMDDALLASLTRTTR